MIEVAPFQAVESSAAVALKLVGNIDAGEAAVEREAA
jgi:hypothetical protein